MRIYVAGKTHDYEVVRDVMNELIGWGHIITYDWTNAVERHGADHDGVPLLNALAQQYAQADLRGVLTADKVIAIPNPDWCGTMLEIGAALTHDIPVIILGRPYQRCIFWAHPFCKRTKDEWPSCKSQLKGSISTHSGLRVEVNGRK